MKKLLALILAAVTVLTLASCNIVGTNDPTGKTEEKTEEQHVDPAQFVDKNDTVYTTTDGVNLRTEPSATSSVHTTLPALTELPRQSANATWSKVTYDGMPYYITNTYITAEDLAGKNFAVCADTTMYATEKVNVRSCPSLANYSKAVKMLNTNDTVTVVGTNDTWSKIKVSEGGENKYYFVSSKYLSATAVVDPDDDSSYKASFTAVSPEKKMYSTATVCLRKGCDSRATVLVYLEEGDEFTVTKTCTTKIDGVTWCYGCYSGGQAPVYGYVSYVMLAETAGTHATLDDILKAYNGYTAVTAKDMYVCAETSVNARSTPSTSSAIKATLTRGTKLSVVAVGPGWSIVEYKAGTFYFVSSAYLTVNSDGTPSALTLDDIKDVYAVNYDFVNRTSVIVKEAYGYVSEDIAETYANDKVKAQGKAAVTFKEGDAVTVVAVEKGDEPKWWIVESEGLCYFVGKSNFQ